jgi:hypothetical protein
LSGREPQIRELLTRLDNVVGVLDQQRDNIIATIQQLRRVAGTFAAQRDVIDRALTDIPPALDVLVRERPRLTTALSKLGQLSDTATRLVNDAGDDLVTNLKNLEPTIKALADVGPDLMTGVRFATAFPYGPTFADRVAKGRLHQPVRRFDITYPRLKRTLFLGTRWGDQDAKFIPAPGRSVLFELLVQPARCGCRAATAGGRKMGRLPPPEAAASGQMPPVTEPVVPVVPPATTAPVTTSSQALRRAVCARGADSVGAVTRRFAAPPAVPADTRRRRLML